MLERDALLRVNHERIKVGLVAGHNGGERDAAVVGLDHASHVGGKDLEADVDQRKLGPILSLCPTLKGQVGLKAFSNLLNSVPVHRWPEKNGASKKGLPRDPGAGCCFLGIFRAVEYTFLDYSTK